MGNRTKKEHQSCAKKAKTVTAHAKCVVSLIDMKKPEESKKKEHFRKSNLFCDKNMAAISGINKKRRWNRIKMMKLHKKRTNRENFFRFKRELPSPRWRIRQMVYCRKKKE